MRYTRLNYKKTDVKVGKTVTITLDERGSSLTDIDFNRTELMNEYVQEHDYQFSK